MKEKVMKKLSKNKSWLLTSFLLIGIGYMVGLVFWNCFQEQNLYNLKQGIKLADQSLVKEVTGINENVIDQVTAIVEVINKKVTDLSDFTIQQHNATLQLIRLNREAIDIVNSKIVDPNLLPKLAKKLTPSIVKIEVHLGVDEYGEGGEEGGEARRNVLPSGMLDQLCSPPSYHKLTGWSGSGVFVAPDLILTAGHVVDRVMIEQNADPEYLWKVGPPIVVKLVDGTELKVVDVYQVDHSLTDLGLLRVEFSNDVNKPTPLTFGKVNVGEQVFAIGEPYGLFPSVTSGIVSAIDVNDPEDFFGKANLLQTDCPINPGNSGCPLINMRGEIIGLCVGAIRPADGIGFCVPADICKQVIELYNAECAFKRECEK